MACELCGIVYRVGTQGAYLTLFPGKLVVSGATEMYDALAKVPNLNSEF
jgi:TATA-box binding protein (TBP) (component of TFIID and TFIIIB)